jgi:hypothetical protein
MICIFVPSNLPLDATKDCDEISALFGAIDPDAELFGECPRFQMHNT